MTDKIKRAEINSYECEKCEWDGLMSGIIRVERAHCPGCGYDGMLHKHDRQASATEKDPAELLAELEALEAKATPGPWYGSAMYLETQNHPIGHPVTFGHLDKAADRALVFALRNSAIPLIRQLLSERDEANEAVVRAFVQRDAGRQERMKLIGQIEVLKTDRARLIDEAIDVQKRIATTITGAMERNEKAAAKLNGIFEVLKGAAEWMPLNQLTELTNRIGEVMERD